MATECLFCRVRDGQIPAKKVYEDETSIAFEDINPQAPTHVLVIPKTHVPTLNDLTEEQSAMVGHLVNVAAKLAKDRGHAQAGYRLVINCGDEAGQTVHHIHMHLLGGRTLTWTA